MGEPSIGPVDRIQRRHPLVGFPIAVVYKFFDDFGGYLCALLTYYGFLSLFPGLLLLSTVVGFVPPPPKMPLKSTACAARAFTNPESWNYEAVDDWRAGGRPVSEAGLFLTAGVDVQKDRIEVDVWAWGRGLESWLAMQTVCV